MFIQYWIFFNGILLSILLFLALYFRSHFFSLAVYCMLANIYECKTPWDYSTKFIIEYFSFIHMAVGK